MRSTSIDLASFMLGELQHADPERRYRAVRFFTRRPYQRALPALLNALGDEDEFVRFWALHAVGKLRDPSCVDALCKVLLDPMEDRDTREEAAHFLGDLGVPRAIAPLIETLREGTVGASAGEALVRFGAASVEPLLNVLSQVSYPQDRANTLAALGRIGDLRAWDPLLVILRNEDEEPFVRMEAVDALEMLLEKTEDPQLRELLDHEETLFYYWQDDSPFKGPPPQKTLPRRARTGGGSRPPSLRESGPDRRVEEDSPPGMRGYKKCSPEQLRWLQSSQGQWSLVEQAFLAALDEPGGKLRAEAAAFGLDEWADVYLPPGRPEENLRRFRRANPGLDPLRERDGYQLALGVLRMLSPENPA